MKTPKFFIALGIFYIASYPPPTGGQTSEPIQPIVCGPGKSRHFRTLGPGQSVSYRTQEGGYYGRGVKCYTTIEKKGKCDLSIDCQDIDIEKGAFFSINGTRFKRGTVSVTAKEVLYVAFKTSRRARRGRGAQCEVRCRGSSEPGIVIAGGKNDPQKVEFWTPGKVHVACVLPELPDNVEDGLTLNFVKEVLVECFSGTCLQLKSTEIDGAAWKFVSNTNQPRRFHTGTPFKDTILLIGGAGSSATTTEWFDFGQSTNTPGFSITPGREKACTIKVDDTTIVITGGSREVSGPFPDKIGIRNVVQYSNLEQKTATATPTNLAPLNQGRYSHSCGLYSMNGEERLIVAGGIGSIGFGIGGLFVDVLDSVETKENRDQASWSTVTALPKRLNAWVGVNVDSHFYVLGGAGPKHGVCDYGYNGTINGTTIAFNREVFEFDGTTTDGKWITSPFPLLFNHELPGITDASLDAIQEFCVKND